MNLIVNIVQLRNSQLDFGNIANTLWWIIQDIKNIRNEWKRSKNEEKKMKRSVIYLFNVCLRMFLHQYLKDILILLHLSLFEWLEGLKRRNSQQKLTNHFFVIWTLNDFSAISFFRILKRHFQFWVCFGERKWKAWRLVSSQSDSSLISLIIQAF